MTAIAFFHSFSETACAENIVFAHTAFKAYIVKNFDDKDRANPDGEIPEAGIKSEPC